MFIETVPESDAAGQLAEFYEADRAALGDVANYTKAFSLRPGVYAAWRALNVEIRGGMDLRRYELATLAAARRLRSTYCSLAHGSVLVDKFLEPDALRSVVADHHAAGLDAVDVAVMDLADKVADDATAVGGGGPRRAARPRALRHGDLRRDRRRRGALLLQQDGRRARRRARRALRAARPAAARRAHGRAAVHRRLTVSRRASRSSRWWT